MSKQETDGYTHSPEENQLNIERRTTRKHNLFPPPTSKDWAETNPSVPLIDSLRLWHFCPVELRQWESISYNLIV